LKAVVAGQATACQQVRASLKTSRSYRASPAARRTVVPAMEGPSGYGVARSRCPGERSSGGRLRAVVGASLV